MQEKGTDPGPTPFTFFSIYYQSRWCGRQRGFALEAVRKVVTQPSWLSRRAGILPALSRERAGSPRDESVRLAGWKPVLRLFGQPLALLKSSKHQVDRDPIRFSATD